MQKITMNTERKKEIRIKVKFKNAMGFSTWVLEFNKNNLAK
jgi:hypothetical protein